MVENIEKIEKINLTSNYEYMYALEQKKVAENNFNNADDEYIEVAIHQYNAALERIRIILRKVKETNKYEREQINI